MASINFNDYEKNQSPGEKTVSKKLTVGSFVTKDTQYYIENENLLFDFIEVDFGEQGIGVESWMSFLGGDFKMKVGMLTKEEFEEAISNNENLGKLFGKYLNEKLGCLECKKEFLEEICRQEHDDFLSDEEEDEDDKGD